MPTEIKQRALRVSRLGRVEYGEALALQKETERDVLTGALPDTLLFVEHPHVLTIGRRATHTGILASQALLEERGVSVFENPRLCFRQRHVLFLFRSVKGASTTATAAPKDRYALYHALLVRIVIGLVLALFAHVALAVALPLGGRRRSSSGCSIRKHVA